MSHPTPHPDIPDPATRQQLNTALAATGAETGFYDENGRPAPWPDDIDQWAPTSNDSTTDPGDHPF
jgi:hypothetical protein